MKCGGMYWQAVRFRCLPIAVLCDIWRVARGFFLLLFCKAVQYMAFCLFPTALHRYSTTRRPSTVFSCRWHWGRCSMREDGSISQNSHYVTNLDNQVVMIFLITNNKMLILFIKLKSTSTLQIYQ